MKSSSFKPESNLCLSFFAYNTLFCVVYGSLIGTVGELTTLFNIHKEVITSLEKYVHAEKMRIKSIQRYSKRWEDQQKWMEQSVNAFSSFALCKSLTVELNFVTELAGNRSTYKRNETLKYPTDKDLRNALNGLIRLETAYWLNATDLAQGTLKGSFGNGRRTYIENFTPLSSSDCYEVGHHLMENEDYSKALLWLAEALNQAKKDEEQIRIHSIITQIKMCYYQLADIEGFTKWNSLSTRHLHKKRVSLIMKLRQGLETDLSESRRKEMISIKKLLRTPGIKRKNKELVMSLFVTLCRGVLRIPAAVSKRLICHYLTDQHPFLILAPVKVEQLYPEPTVRIVHDVISDDEIQHLKDISEAHMYRSQVVVHPSRIEQLNDVGRYSLIAWLPDEMSEVVARLSRRVAHFTGLDVHTAESLQVCVYGIAGHFMPHHDFPKIKDAVVPITGGRIATVMFYLSDVEQGGATVFTELGLTVYPKKGSALVWPNLHPSGKWDEATVHAGCPVLRGSKWVANKWLLEAGQELKWPCPTVGK